MAAAFRIYRILCSTPPDLETERLAFESTLAAFGEEVTFPQQILFAGASFRPPFHAARNRALGMDNIRQCDFFLHICSPAWPGSEFRAFIDFAQECIGDPALPMRRTAVLFKNYSEAVQEVRNYRDNLSTQGQCDIREFRDATELDRVLHEIFSSWWESVQAKP
jgi:hypothetical protein